MRYSKPVVVDSLTGEEVSEEEVHTIYIHMHHEAVALDLTTKSLAAFRKAIEPFSEREEWKSARVSFTRAASTESDSKRKQPTREERAAISAFVEEQGLGTVSRGGLVRQAYIDAWEAAGRPGV